MIDTGMIMGAIRVGVERALQNTGQFALGRARHHAPVRAVFDRRLSPRGRMFSGKKAGGDERPIATAEDYRAFRASQSRRRRVDVRRSQAEIRETASAASYGGGRLEENTRIQPGSDLARRAIAQRAKGRFSGHANTSLPVFRDRGYTIVGDFRRVGRVPEIIRQRHGITSARVVRAESIRQHRRAYFSGGQRPNFTKFRNERLSTRGRYEFGTRRALYKGRIGGRLRGEIRLTPLTWEGNAAWLSVESPTEYSEYQEFGTSRHRAQPFLRPALYESRQALLREARRVGEYSGGSR